MCFWCDLCEGEYDELCPGGFGFRPNEVTVILEGLSVYLYLYSSEERDSNQTNKKKEKK